MNKKKVKAFTIMEMTIAMLISAIVIGITYSAYTIISRSYTIYQTKNDGLALLSRIDQLLVKDFAHAEMISKTLDGLLLTSRLDTVAYVFAPDFIVRKGAVIDTFKVQTSGLSTLFENQPVSEVSVESEQNRIDELFFFIVLKNGNMPYHYQKPYSSVNLLERNPNAVN
jgi:prepilin-type N-terminal cleavage/methylation domain-containing protein